MNIAISAASGRLGHAILRALHNEMSVDHVTAIARNPDRVRAFGVEKLSGDYSDAGEMQTALANKDTLIMISAPVAGGGDRLEMHRNVIEAARAAGVRKIVYTSVIGNGMEEGTNFQDFARLNRATEALIKASDLEWVIARNGLYLDLDLQHIKAADSGDGVYRNNGGNGKCGYISIEELGFGLTRLAISDNFNKKTVNLIGETYTQQELVEIANEVLGLNVKYESISFDDNVAKFMAIPAFAARGEQVIKMLSGCFECIEKGAFDVESHFETVAGRKPRPIKEQMQRIAATW